MEAVALAALLGVGYVLTGNTFAQTQSQSQAPRRRDTEGFYSQPPPQEAGATVDTVPPPTGYPRPVRPTADGTLDMFYQLPAADSTGPELFTPTFPPPVTGVTMNLPGLEEPPTYNGGQPFVSQLSGQAISADDFTHNNMVPFFKGQPKQNITDDANRSLLDQKIGTGYNMISKREQAPLFDPVREPMGNVTGLESTTDFMQDRIVTSTNRAFERPVEPTRVGPGIGQGYSSIPIGGFQQYEVQDVGRRNISIDELRAASNPRISYEGVMNAGVAIGTVRGEIGEVRHYNPDRFHLNEHGERNFVGPTADNLRPTVRSSQVMKFQARSETSTENFAGPAVAADFSATYTTPSFRAPFTQQNESYGFRNADGSWAGVANTDAPNNDYGASAIEMFANQRSVTGERGQALNLSGMAAAPQALTVYDPNDVARTTVRETTGANDWIGGAVAVAAKKLTVYDPTDIARPTHRNTNAEVDTALNVTRAGIPGAATLAFPDGIRVTSKQSIAESAGYIAPGGRTRAPGEQVYDSAYAMRQNGLKELTAQGRAPIAGNGNKPLFNGEDYINMTNRKLMTDVLNDRDNTVNRVVGHATGVDSVGLQRPKDVLQMDVARDRNYTDVLSALNSNPYALPVHQIAAQQGQGSPFYDPQRSTAWQ